MAILEDTTTSAAASSLKALSLTQIPEIATAINITGGILVAMGVIIAGVPIIYLGKKYIVRKVNKRKDGSMEVTASSMNGKVIMSLVVAATLLICVGTAMLPRTETVMIIHIAAGYTCLVISFIHVYQYRNVIKAQAKKYFGFLNSPKSAAVKSLKASKA